MSQNLPETPSTSNYQVIFDNALKAYKNKTGKDLSSDPLTRKIESCNSPDTVLRLLREQIPGFDQSGGSHDGPTKWLDPTVNVLYAFSSTIGGAVSLVSLGKIMAIHAGLALISVSQTYPPAGVIFTGIASLLLVSVFTVTFCTLP